MATKKKIKALSASESTINYSKAHLAPELPGREVILGYYSVSNAVYNKVQEQYLFIRYHLQEEKSYSAEDICGYFVWGRFSPEERFEAELCLLHWTLQPDPFIKAVTNIDSQSDNKIKFIIIKN